jgi:hypothetical protein
MEFSLTQRHKETLSESNGGGLHVVLGLAAVGLAPLVPRPCSSFDWAAFAATFPGSPGGWLALRHGLCNLLRPGSLGDFSDPPAR